MLRGAPHVYQGGLSGVSSHWWRPGINYEVFMGGLYKMSKFTALQNDAFSKILSL